MKSKYKIPALISLTLFILTSYGIFAQNRYETITAIQSDSLISANASNSNFVILDVRRATEWSSNHINGSINRDYYQSTFRQELDDLPKHKMFLIHCQSGGRSAKAFAIMQELGFAEVYNMTGGIGSWKNHSFPVSTETAPLLMLVSSEGSTGSGTDTVRVTLTNRANDLLIFNSLTVEDNHQLSHNFDHEVILEGAEDYTFSIYHSPAYEHEDSTRIIIESNGGSLDFKVKAEKSVSTDIALGEKDIFEVYPNPTSKDLHFKGISSYAIKEIRIYNLAGTCVLHKSDHPTHKNLSLLNLNEGIHVVVVRTGDSVLSKKILLKR